ncbi:MAG: DsbA family protein [Rhodoferax sp.]|nr:DsbA family protein [Rhodoferax sp.]MDP3651787.1 DsbA family protein [Rhodoferax sp.]
MSLKTWLTPIVMAHLLSPQRLENKRAAFEKRRAARGEPHVLHYFHQSDDPYSALLSSVLPQLQARYHIAIQTHLVSPPADAAAPERAKLVAYSQRDAALLAAHHGLPATAAHSGADVQPSDPQETREQADRLRQQWGHYLGAMLYYGGEWYWGIDRLHHLEARLQALGLQTDAADPGAKRSLFPPSVDLHQAVALRKPAPIDFFFSFRSPYSAIVAARVFELGRLTGAEVRLRFVLPMVMRGLPVPREKRRYIVFDTAREARLRGIAFGRLNDPVGQPTERGLSLIPLAQAQGRGQAYVLSFLQGVWSEGLDAGSDRDLARIVERAGLSWAQAQTALTDPGWRLEAEANRAEMFALGLWGVPSFRVNDVAVWGQDRLWAVQDALMAPS